MNVTLTRIFAIFVLCGSLISLVKSDETDISTLPTSTNSPITTSEVTITTASPTESPITEPDTSTSNWSVDPDCQTGGLYPYVGDCTKYWECDNGVKYLMNCPEGLYFNPTLLICDYPDQSGCEYDKDESHPYLFGF